MKLLTFKRQLILIIGTFLCGGIEEAKAVTTTYLFNFDPNSVAKERDPYYVAKYGDDDTTSCLFTSTTDFQPGPDSPTNRVVATMFGRHYDTDPERGDDWGLLDPADPNFQELNGLLNGYVLKYGLQPKEFGSTESKMTLADGTVVPASYLSFRVKADDTVMFTNVQLHLDELTAIEHTDTVWGGIFSGDQITPLVPKITESEKDGVNLSLSWPEMTITADDLEVRIYGLKGADYGNYKAAALSGTITRPPVPEVSSSLLILVASIGIFCRRHRKLA